MDFLIILFVFILPAAAIALSVYCMIQIFNLKRIGSKLAALSRISGKDMSYDRSSQ